MSEYVPQIIVIVLLSLKVGLHLAKHGKPQEGTYSFPMAVSANATLVALLWWGGFFS